MIKIIKDIAPALKPTLITLSPMSQMDYLLWYMRDGSAFTEMELQRCAYRFPMEIIRKAIQFGFIVPHGDDLPQRYRLAEASE